MELAQLFFSVALFNAIAMLDFAPPVPGANEESDDGGDHGSDRCSFSAGCHDGGDAGSNGTCSRSRPLVAGSTAKLVDYILHDPNGIKYTYAQKGNILATDAVGRMLTAHAELDPVMQAEFEAAKKLWQHAEQELRIQMTIDLRNKLK